jgi:formiminoglutamase
MSGEGAGWLTVRRGNARLIVSLPHTGAEIPDDIASKLLSPWLARKDTDWWIDRLYDFASQLDATIVHTAISRTVIDVNRDPSGASLYPGMATTELVSPITFDGEPLYAEGSTPSTDEVADRRKRYFDPYHNALAAEIDRLRQRHKHIVLYDCHSIRSNIPRLFDGDLPNLNLGTNNGVSCLPAFTEAIAAICAPPFTFVANGRFNGGWITRHYGLPAGGVHAIQMELACRGYMNEPPAPSPANWPAPYDIVVAQPMRSLLRKILEACLAQVASLNNSKTTKDT